jgi:hypothetical protein
LSPVPEGSDATYSTSAAGSGVNFTALLAKRLPVSDLFSLEL